MFKKISLLIVSAITGLTMATFALAPAVYAQDAVNTINCGVEGALGSVSPTPGEGCPVPESADQSVNNAIKLVIRILQVLVGIVSVVMIIFGGLKYITSNGDASQIGGAKNTIIYACIGLIIVALAEVIVQFVLNRVNTVTA